MDAQAASPHNEQVKPDVCKALGERIRALRQDRKLSQERFADLCGLDRTYISGIERGTRNPSLKNIALIAKTLKVSLRDLFEGV